MHKVYKWKITATTPIKDISIAPFHTSRKKMIKMMEQIEIPYAIPIFKRYILIETTNKSKINLPNITFTPYL